MTHPIKSPFFSHPISIEGSRRDGDAVRKLSGTVGSVVVDDGEADFGEAVTQKTIKQRSFFIRRMDWFDRTPPQAGDIITDEFGDRFGVERVSELPILGWNCAAREI